MQPQKLLLSSIIDNTAIKISRFEWASADDRVNLCPCVLVKSLTPIITRVYAYDGQQPRDIIVIYTSPRRSSNCDAATDLRNLGVLAHTLLCGYAPFKADNEVMRTDMSFVLGLQSFVGSTFVVVFLV